MMADTSQIDFIVRKFQETVKIAQDLKSELEKTNKSLTEVRDEISSLGISGNSVSALIAEMDKKHSSLKGEMNFSLDGLLKSVAEFKSNIKELSLKSGEQDSLNAKCQTFLQLIKKESEAFVSKKVLSEFVESFEKSLASSMQFPLRLAKEISGLQEKHLTHEKEIFSQAEKIDEYATQINSRLDSLKFDVSSKIAVLETSVFNMVSTYQSAINAYVNDQISKIPQPVIPNLDDAKKQMKSQMEPVSLDARNSLLRSVNNESKITILEKKVEQLQLVLNKLQLQGH